VTVSSRFASFPVRAAGAGTRFNVAWERIAAVEASAASISGAGTVWGRHGSAAQGHKIKHPTYQPQLRHPWSQQAVLLFDIDGVIRMWAAVTVAALAETVEHFCGWRPAKPLVLGRAQGRRDLEQRWDAALEHCCAATATNPCRPMPPWLDVSAAFYFGGDPQGDPAGWSGSFATNRVVEGGLFKASALPDRLGICEWCRARLSRYVLFGPAGNLGDPPLVAMGDAPDKTESPPAWLSARHQLWWRRPGGWSPTRRYLVTPFADVQTC